MSTRPIGSKFAVLAALAFVLCNALCPAMAQDAVPDFYKEPGIYPNRDYVNQHATENVDPFTGSLQLHATDVYLPGNGGFDLQVTRSFNSNRINPDNPADLTTSSLAGVGWTVHFGRVLKNRSANFCINTDGGTAIGDNPVIELPDGSRQILAFTPTASPLMMTTQRWRADCVNAGGLTVYSPDGIRYDMTQQVVELAGPQPIYAWYTTRITDRNGNFASVTYAANFSPQISSVTSSDGRSIAFTYLDSGLASRRIQTLVADGRTWTYNYQAVAGIAGSYFLTSVTRPDTAGSAWRYQYNPFIGNNNANNYQLLQAAYPQGGTMRYGYGYVYFDTVTNPASRSVVVASKTTSDGGSSRHDHVPTRGRELRSIRLGMAHRPVDAKNHRQRTDRDLHLGIAKDLRRKQFAPGCISQPDRYRGLCADPDPADHRPKWGDVPDDVFQSRRLRKSGHHRRARTEWREPHDERHVLRQHESLDRPSSRRRDNSWCGRSHPDMGHLRQSGF